MKSIEESKEFVQSHYEWYAPVAKQLDGKVLNGKVMTFNSNMRKYMLGIAKQFKKCDENVAAAALELAKQFK